VLAHALRRTQVRQIYNVRQKMKIIAGFAVLVYGIVVSVAVLLLISFGNAGIAMNSGGAGTRSVSMVTRLGFLPTAFFYLCLSWFAYQGRAQFRRLLKFAICGLLLLDVLALGVGDGLVLFIFGLLSLLPVALIAFSKPSSPPPYATEKSRTEP
jgi:hypothetical protein